VGTFGSIMGAISDLIVSLCQPTVAMLAKA